MMVGTFFGIPVVIGELLSVGNRTLGVVTDWDEQAQLFVLNGTQPIELDQAH